MKPSTHPTATPTPTLDSHRSPQKVEACLLGCPPGFESTSSPGSSRFPIWRGKRGDPENEVAWNLIQFQPCFKSGLVSSNLLFVRTSWPTFFNIKSPTVSTVHFFSNNYWHKAQFIRCASAVTNFFESKFTSTTFEFGSASSSLLYDGGTAVIQTMCLCREV